MFHLVRFSKVCLDAKRRERKVTGLVVVLFVSQMSVFHWVVLRSPTLVEIGVLGLGIAMAPETFSGSRFCYGQEEKSHCKSAEDQGLFFHEKGFNSCCL